MHLRFTFPTLLLSVAMLSTNAQKTVPWTLNGNNNATATSVLGTTNAVPLNLTTGGQTRLRIDANGNVGIGTTTPTYKFHVVGNSAFTGNTSFTGNGTFTGNVGIGTTSPDASALLDVSSTTQGMLIPRMTQAERDAIASPATGLLVFQSDGTAGFYYYDGEWKAVSPPTSGFAAKSLNNLTAPTAVNVDLNPGSSNAYNLGSATTQWKDIHFSGDFFLQGNSFISRRGTNNFFGQLAGNPSVLGSKNTATGYNALTRVTSGSWNTANGHEASQNVTFGNSNTALGHSALYATTGGYNTATGVAALEANTTGEGNTASGVAALLFLNSGNGNTAMGFHAALNLPSGNYNTFLGANADISFGAGALSNATAIGYQAQVTASNAVRVGNTAVTSIGGQVNWTAFSDGRFKKNIKEEVPGLQFINQLRPVTYTLDVEGIDKRLRPASTGQRSNNDVIGKTSEPTSEELQAKRAKASVVYTGFIAQEVEATAQKQNYEFSGVDKPKNDKDFYGLRYGDFVVPLVKAVQELDAENKKLKEELAELRQMMLDIKNGRTGTVTSISGYLEQNSPNPAGGTTTIRYAVPTNASSARLTLTNAKGQQLKAIVLSNRGSGQVSLDTQGLASGTYNYTLYVDGKQADTKRLVIAR